MNPCSEPKYCKAPKLHPLKRRILNAHFEDQESQVPIVEDESGDSVQMRTFLGRALAPEPAPGTYYVGDLARQVRFESAVRDYSGTLRLKAGDSASIRNQPLGKTWVCPPQYYNPTSSTWVESVAIRGSTRINEANCRAEPACQIWSAR